jgi:hypothetical protein
VVEVGSRTDPASAEARRGDDRSTIPFRLRIGVTGHRRLDGIRELGARVEEALEKIRDAVAASVRTDVLFEAVSPLGEGADQLVARTVLEHAGATLDVPLPMSAETYLEDFQTDEGKLEFRRLLGFARAQGVVSEQSDRALAYRDVGRYVASTSDVLVVVWDGLGARGAGGTKEIRDWANERGMPIVVISANPPFEFLEVRLHGLAKRAVDTDRYNRAHIKDQDRAVEGQERRWQDACDRCRLDFALLVPLVQWIGPHFIRADLLAKRYRAWFSWVGAALFLLAAAAVGTIGAQIAFGLDRRWAWLEAGLMAMGLLTWVALRLVVRDRRVAYRFLAERYRANFFLAVTGVDLSDRLGGRREADAREEWLAKALREVWRQLPTERLDLPLEGVKCLLKSWWVDAQVNYYTSRGDWHHRRHRRSNVVVASLFVATLAAAVLHAGGWLEGGSQGETLSFLAIFLPALATAITGIAAMRQDLRNTERFRTMVRRLSPIGEGLEIALGADSVRALALRADKEMLAETGDWIDVMRFHQVEMPV